MAVTLYRTGTEYTSNALSINRGQVSDILAVGVYHNGDPTHIPAVSEFTIVTLADGTANSPSPLAVAGEVDVVALIGPKVGAQLALTAGTFQRWVYVSTAAEDIIRKVDTITVI